MREEPRSRRSPRPTSRRPSVQTSDERDAPFGESPELLAAERAAAAAQPAQLALFAPGPAGSFQPVLAGLQPLDGSSSLDLARTWFRIELERKRRPANTVESYCYDLVKLEERIGPKPIDQIGHADIANFLGLADNRATRKRRLTSVRRLFEYLVDDQKVLDVNPVDGFFPHRIALQTPVPLFANEQIAFEAAAAADEPWSLVAVYLMLRFGLTRAELLALRRDNVDLSDPDQPVVHVLYDDPTKHHKERKFAGDVEFASAYAALIEAAAPVDLLFPVGFQAVNGMVDRVAKAAGIAKEVTPQVLRHTFAVERAKAGANEEQLIALLGLLDEPRNRESVRRYLKLAAPPM